VSDEAVIREALTLAGSLPLSVPEHHYERLQRLDELTLSMRPGNPALAALDRLVARLEAAESAAVAWLEPFEGSGIEWHESRPMPFTYAASDFSALVAATHEYEARYLAAEAALAEAREALRDIATRRWRDEGGRIAAAVARDGLAAAGETAPSKKTSGGDPVEVRPSDSRAESQAGLKGPSGCPTSPPEPESDEARSGAGASAADALTAAGTDPPGSEPHSYSLPPDARSAAR
jgi:hypothetical protein